MVIVRGRPQKIGKMDGDNFCEYESRGIVACSEMIDYAKRSKKPEPRLSPTLLLRLAGDGEHEMPGCVQVQFCNVREVE
jgi:hypothetical protein